jgi:hypothetical protein
MPSRHRLSIPHRNAVAATLGKDAVSRTLRSSDRFGGRRVFFFWRRGFVLRRFCVVLVRQRVGGELGGGHGERGQPRPVQEYARRPATRTARPFFGGRVLVVVSPRRRAWFAAASRVLCGWVRAEARAAFFAFLTRGARVFPQKRVFSMRKLYCPQSPINRFVSPMSSSVKTVMP